MTPIDLITSYLRSLAVRADNQAISHQTLVTYTQGIKAFAKVVGVNAPVTLDTYITFLKKLNTVSPSSVRTYKAGVLDFYKFCKLEYGIEMDWINMKEATRLYTQKPKPTLVTYDENAVDKLVIFALTRLNANLVDLRNRAFIITVADTGLRKFELCALLIKDVDWETQSVVIKGKGDKHARVRFSDRSIQFLKEYLQARAELDSKYPDRDSLPLLARHDKSASARIEPVGGGGMWAAIKAVGRQAGLDVDKLWPHVLRHRFVTTVWRQTSDLKKAQKLARHSNIETTSRYAHLSEPEMDDTYDQIFNQTV